MWRGVMDSSSSSSMVQLLAFTAKCAAAWRTRERRLGRGETACSASGQGLRQARIDAGQAGSTALDVLLIDSLGIHIVLLSESVLHSSPEQHGMPSPTVQVAFSARHSAQHKKVQCGPRRGWANLCGEAALCWQGVHGSAVSVAPHNSTVRPSSRCRCPLSYRHDGRSDGTHRHKPDPDTTAVKR